MTVLLREAFKKKIKSVDFFNTGGGGLGSNFHTFLDIFYLLKKNFVLFHPVFVGWKVIFRVKMEKNFPPQNVFPHL